jgi:3-oxoacyl-[acyl-carrier protein] reductase
MNLQLDGKRALVTGSSAGIGKAIALKLAEEGARVAVAGRNGGRAVEVASEIEHVTKRPGAVATGDLATDEGADKVVDAVLDAFGGIDILVNNHGAYHPRGWWNTTAADWAEMYNQNVVSFVRMIHRIGPAMRSAGWGRIVNISSGGAWQPFATMADYTSTKAAILNLTVSLAREFAGTGVTANAVSPGIIVTEATEAYFRKFASDQGWPDDWAQIEQRVMATFLPNSSGRLGTPADVANLVAIIASPLSGYMNGANYRVDGGSTISIN